MQGARCKGAGCKDPCSLFVSEAANRVRAKRAAGRDVAGHERDGAKQEGHEGEDQGIGPAHANEQVADQRAGGERQEQAGSEAKTGERPTLLQDERDNIARGLVSGYVRSRRAATVSIAACA